MEQETKRDSLPVLTVKVCESPELRTAVSQIRLAQAHSELIFNYAISEDSEEN